MPLIKVASWNLQNLFDTTASNIAADLEFTPEQGWDDEALDKKLTNLATVIKAMHGGQGAELLGIVEVETKPLLEDLVARTGLPNLKVAHADNPDLRGIDTSLVYNAQVFDLAAEPISHVMHLRHRTRDVFQVPLTVKANGAALHVFVNHWPSRSAGQYETEPLRIAVAENCARLLDRLVKFERDEYLALPDTPDTLDALNARFDTNALFMGDFNDEPSSRSLVEYALAGKDLDHIEEVVKKASANDTSGRKHTPAPARYLEQRAYLFNCMAQLSGAADTGTLHFSQGTNTMNLLDHFLVSRGLLFGRARLKLQLDSVRIFRAPTMTSDGKQRPIAFDKKTKKGTSDHFPIVAVIEIL
jgi:endonuclease/exonuclease/phosphatase family metal-dependent hydrolase